VGLLTEITGIEEFMMPVLIFGLIAVLIVVGLIFGYLWEKRRREAFQKLASEYRSHEKAAQAATFAYQLWGKVAQRTRRPLTS